MPLEVLNGVSKSQSIKDLVSGEPRRVADDLVLKFFADLSKVIFSRKSLRAYPDIITFGYFCRKNWLRTELSKTLTDELRFGWGRLVHIAPSNVPVNFAFSLLFGMLSGNQNVVRLPSVRWHETELLAKLITEVLSAAPYRALARENVFIRSERDSSSLVSLIENSAGTVVWGNNNTIKTFRSIVRRPRAKEIYFPDRKSALLISAEAILALSERQMSDTAKAFYDDTFLMDCNACSSPGKIFWVGDCKKILEARGIFWRSVGMLLSEKKYSLAPSAKMDKFLNVLDTTIDLKGPFLLERLSPEIWLAEAPDESSSGNLGTFFEVHAKSLDYAIRNIGSEFQTLTHIGFDTCHILSLVGQKNFYVDRVVASGKALEMSLVWDGIDVIRSLSRLVSGK